MLMTVNTFPHRLMRPHPLVSLKRSLVLHTDNIHMA
jgi:hypothetical protein